jgi:hypothetical protein
MMTQEIKACVVAALHRQVACGMRFDRHRFPGGCHTGEGGGIHPWHERSWLFQLTSSFP